MNSNQRAKFYWLFTKAMNIFIQPINVHQSDKFSSHWYFFFIKMMNLHQCDEFHYHNQSDELSSNWQIFIKVSIFHQRDDSSSKWWVFIKVMHFHQRANSYKNPQFSPKTSSFIKVLNVQFIIVIYVPQISQNLT